MNSRVECLANILLLCYHVALQSFTQHVIKEGCKQKMKSHSERDEEVSEEDLDNHGMNVTFENYFYYNYA